MTTREAIQVSAARRALANGSAQRLVEAAKLSQRDVAAACGVSVAAVCKWFSGEHVPQSVAALLLGRLLESIRADLVREEIGV